MLICCISLAFILLSLGFLDRLSLANRLFACIDRRMLGILSGSLCIKLLLTIQSFLHPLVSLLNLRQQRLFLEIYGFLDLLKINRVVIFLLVNIIIYKLLSKFFYYRIVFNAELLLFLRGFIVYNYSITNFIELVIIVNVLLLQNLHSSTR